MQHDATDFWYRNTLVLTTMGRVVGSRLALASSDCIWAANQLAFTSPSTVPSGTWYSAPWSRGTVIDTAGSVLAASWTWYPVPIWLNADRTTPPRVCAGSPEGRPAG